MSSLVELAYNVVDDFPCVKEPKSKVKERSCVQIHAEPASKNEPTGNSTSSKYTPKKPCAVCKTEGHRMSECGRFKSTNIDGSGIGSRARILQIMFELSWKVAVQDSKGMWDQRLSTEASSSATFVDHSRAGSRINESSWRAEDD